MAKSKIGASYWQIIPTLEGLEKAIEDEVKQATREGYEVPVEAKVDDQKLDNDMGKSGDKSGKLFGDKFKTAFVASGAIVAIGALAGKALYDVGEQFDSMNDSIVIGTGATGAELEGLQDTAKNIFSQIPTNAADAGNAVADLNQRLGLTGDNLEGVAVQVLEAGRLLGEQVDINALGGAFRQFNVEAQDMESALDAVFATSQASGVGFNARLGGVEQNSAALKALGLDFDSSVALIGQLDKAGLDANSTLTQISKGIVNFAKDGQPAQEAIAQVVTQIDSLIKSGDEAAAIDLASQLFGARGALNVVNAIQSGAISAESFNNSISGLNSTILGTAEATNDFAEKWQIFQNEALIALEPLGTKVLELASAFLDDAIPALTVFLDVLTQFTTFLADNEWALNGIIAIIGGALVVALIAATAAAWAFVAPILANPLTWIILGAIVAIGLLIAAFGWIIENWDLVVGFFSDSFTFIGEMFTALGAGIGNFFIGVGEFIVNAFLGVSNFVLGIINGIISAINEIIGFLPGLFGINMGGVLPNVSFGLPSSISLPRLAEGATVKASEGGTLAVLAEAGRSETVVDEGKMNALIDSILTGSVGSGTAGAPIVNLYITQKENQSMQEFIEELIKEIKFQLTGGAEYQYA